MQQTDPSRRSPNTQDAAVIKGMLARGDPIHDVASWFGFNQGRVAEIKTGKRHKDVMAASQTVLPPKGPYLSIGSMSEMFENIAKEYFTRLNIEIAKIAQDRRQTNEKLDLLMRLISQYRNEINSTDRTMVPRSSKRKPIAE